MHAVGRVALSVNNIYLVTIRLLFEVWQLKYKIKMPSKNDLQVVRRVALSARKHIHIAICLA